MWSSIQAWRANRVAKADRRAMYLEALHEASIISEMSIAMVRRGQEPPPEWRARRELLIERMREFS